MHPVIQYQVLPLVGSVKLEGFDQNKFGHSLGLQTKIQKHVASQNAEKLKMYLAFCIQEWPSIEDCPVDRQLIGKAIRVIQHFNKTPSPTETHVDGRVIPAGCQAVSGPGGKVGIFDPSTGRSRY